MGENHTACFYGNVAHKYFPSSCFEVSMRKVCICILNYRMPGLHKESRKKGRIYKLLIYFNILLQLHSVLFRPFCRGSRCAYWAFTVHICAFERPNMPLYRSCFGQIKLRLRKSQRRRRRRKKTSITKKMFLLHFLAFCVVLY